MANRLILTAFAAAAACLMGGQAQAQSGPTGWVPLNRITSAMSDLNRNYGDVPMPVKCVRPGSGVERIICGNPYLQQAALLNAKLQVREYENGTKREQDHKTFKIRLPTNCKDENCVYRTFEQHAEETMDESPYKS